MQIIGFIHAKAHNTRLPGKHLRRIDDVPLIERVIDTALESQFLDELILSTDCDDMNAIAERRKVQVWKRQPPYNSDEVSGQEVMLNDWQMWKERNRSVKSWCVDIMGNTLILRRGLIDELIEMAKNHPDAARVCGVTRFEHCWPSLCRYFKDGGEIRPLMEYATTATVNMPVPYYEIGTPYVSLVEKNYGGRQIGLPLDPNDAVHIHNHDDMELAEWLWSRKKLKPTTAPSSLAAASR
jgi:CMP-N-acetylneuraminic acid synthetase